METIGHPSDGVAGVIRTVVTTVAVVALAAALAALAAGGVGPRTAGGEASPDATAAAVGSSTTGATHAPDPFPDTLVGAWEGDGGRRITFHDDGAFSLRGAPAGPVAGSAQGRAAVSGAHVRLRLDDGVVLTYRWQVTAGCAYDACWRTLHLSDGTDTWGYGQG